MENLNYHTWFRITSTTFWSPLVLQTIEETHNYKKDCFESPETKAERTKFKARNSEYMQKVQFSNNIFNDAINWMDFKEQKFCQMFLASEFSSWE